MSEAQSIQWFPGHMTRTKRQIEKSLKLVDAVAEIIDARIPVSSRNPVLDKLIQSKPRVILMNKCDMADPAQTARWIAYYKAQGIPAIAIDCKTNKGLNGFIPLVKEVLKDRIAAWQAKGMVCRQIRVMVVGVTRSNQWFSIAKGFELLDTPGVLWPKFEDKEVGEHLAFTGAVKDEVVDTEHLASRLLEVLRDRYADAVKQRYKLGDIDLSELKGYEILEWIGKKRGMLISGGEIDTERASIAVLDEFRGAKMGRITLEAAPAPAGK